MKAVHRTKTAIIVALALTCLSLTILWPGWSDELKAAGYKKLNISIRDLGTLGGDFSKANAINENGLIVGESTNASGETHAFSSNAFTMIDLGIWLDWYVAYNHRFSSHARAVNNRGQVVGESTLAFVGSKNDEEVDVAVLFKDGSVTQLWGHWTEYPDLYAGPSHAYGIDDLDEIVGSSNFIVFSPPYLYSHEIHAFSFRSLGNDRSITMDLGTLGGDMSEAYGIDGGVIVGRSKTASGEIHAVSWSGSLGTSYSIKDLGTLGGDMSEAYGVNYGGAIVGRSKTASGEIHAFLWQKREMRDLGTLGGDMSEAYGINRSGAIVGRSKTASGEIHAFLWQKGEMTDLGTVGGDMSEANGINDRGQIVGSSKTAWGETHAVMWTIDK